MSEGKNSYFEFSKPEKCLQSLWKEKKWVGFTQYMWSSLFPFKSYPNLGFNYFAKNIVQ
jgi:hypothetical protein